MKKLIALLLAIVCLACFASCGEDETESMYLDISEMSTTMAYTQVYNMTNFPDQFTDKTIKMKGILATDEEESTYFCGVIDEAACCAAYMEFSWAGEHAKEDYPAFGTVVTVEGKFSTYVEDGKTYTKLIDATMTW